MPIIAPQNAHELPVFYLFWILLYLTINVIWDVRSKRTREFHFAHFTEKTPVAFNAASLASSILLLSGLINPQTMKVAGDTMVPIMLAGFSGIFFGLSEICPYKPSQNKGTP